MYRTYGMPRAQDAQERRGTGRTGRKSFLSFSTLPPSLAVVAAGAGRHTGCISVARSRMLGATAQERRVIGDYVQDVRYAAGAWMHRSGG